MSLTDLLLDPTTRAALDRAIVLAVLVMARVAPVVQFTPYLGGKAVPPQVKVAISLALAALVYPVMLAGGASAALPESPALWAALVFKEIALGALMGFVVALTFEAVRIAGQLIDTVRGQNMATVLVPQLPERVSLSANLLYQLSIVSFVALGGHRLFVAALIRSFQIHPPHHLPALGDQGPVIVGHLITLGADTVSLGVMLAFPVIAAVLLTDLCLALVNRAAPSINVFFLGMPLKALVGVAVLLGTAHVIVDTVMRAAGAQIDTLTTLLSMLAPGG